MSASDFASDFYKLFAGNRAFYVEHIFNIDESKKKSNDKIQGEAYFKDIEVTEYHYEKHLEGKKGLGVCPIDSDNKCRFGVIDIDSYGISYGHLINTIYENNLPLVPFRSKSGGLHLYLFLRREVQAKKIISALEDVCSILGLKETYMSRGKTKVEIIPKQARLAPGGHGATITIPYYRCDKPKSFMYGTNMTELSAEAAVKAIKAQTTSLEDLSLALEQLPFADAPKCIQTILLGPSLEKDSGRNNFIFSCAVYLKKKHGDKFLDKLQEMNNLLIDPLEDTAVKKTYESVVANEYNYKCKDIPCEQFCNKGVCSKREFGIGKEKGHFTGLDYGVLVRYKAEEPYYVWELKKMDDDEYKKVTFKNATQLMDQRFFAAMCIDNLDFAPVMLSNGDWAKVLTTCLKKVKEESVVSTSDTSSLAEIKSAFYEYLSQKRTRREMPYQIKLGLVHVVGEELYFTHKGFQEYLDVMKLKLVNSNLREILLSFGAVEARLDYVSKRGINMTVPCWMKKVDDKLKELTEYFSDVIEGDIGVIASTKESVAKAMENTTSESDVEHSDGDELEAEDVDEEDALF